MNVYTVTSLLGLIFVVCLGLIILKVYEHAVERISTKKLVIGVIEQVILFTIAFAILFGMNMLKIPTDKTIYAEITSARYTQEISRTLIYSRQYDYIEASFKKDGKIIHYKFPVADVVVTEENEQSMVGISTIFHPYVLYMTEDDYNNVLGAQKLGDEK